MRSGLDLSRVFKNAINNTFVRFLGSCMFMSVLLWLCVVGLEYSVFCKEIVNNTKGVLGSPEVLTVESLEGYSIESYTRVCTSYSIMVIGDSIAALPVSIGELDNLVKMPLVVYAVTGLVCLVLLLVAEKGRFRVIGSGLYVVVLYLFEVTFIKSTYNLVYGDSNPSFILVMSVVLLMVFFYIKNLFLIKNILK